ncbi:MAG: outer membrane beta-barrel protein [Flavobacteriales bacterium]|nr:outer membrane beta-barrel protein [Flavobacteriales bacterium]MDP4731520.1 outer membrane beta-barrel protein [Flavobacteriales bacterium]MDP4817870.1 outer membrane beta-barrel protein [Flavobacteriales bacterium]MDP4950252.1 outer membrane beta-barrel protein [Flavobacteriales bacterium]
MKNFHQVAIFIIFTVLMSFSATAQTPYRQFGIKAGMNISNVKTDIPSYTTKDIIGGNLSITYDRVRMRFLTIGGEFNWVQRGFTNPITITDSAGLAIGVADLRNKFNYFSVPVKLGVQFGNRVYIFGNAAFIPGYLLKAISEVPVVDENGQVIDYTWQDATNNAAQFDLSTQIEVGIGVTKAKRYKFYVSAAKQQALLNIFDDPQSTFNIKSTGIIISTGMKIEFGKGLFR